MDQRVFGARPGRHDALGHDQSPEPVRDGQLERRPALGKPRAPADRAQSAANAPGRHRGRVPFLGQPAHQPRRRDSVPPDGDLERLSERGRGLPAGHQRRPSELQGRERQLAEDRHGADDHRRRRCPEQCRPVVVRPARLGRCHRRERPRRHAGDDHSRRARQPSGLFGQCGVLRRDPPRDRRDLPGRAGRAGREPGHRRAASRPALDPVRPGGDRAEPHSFGRRRGQCDRRHRRNRVLASRALDDGDSRRLPAAWRSDDPGRSFDDGRRRPLSADLHAGHGVVDGPSPPLPGDPGPVHHLHHRGGWRARLVGGHVREYLVLRRLVPELGLPGRLRRQRAHLPHGRRLRLRRQLRGDHLCALLRDLRVSPCLRGHRRRLRIRPDPVCVRGNGPLLGRRGRALRRNDQQPGDGPHGRRVRTDHVHRHLARAELGDGRPRRCGHVLTDRRRRLVLQRRVPIRHERGCRLRAPADDLLQRDVDNLARTRPDGGAGGIDHQRAGHGQQHLRRLQLERVRPQ